MNRGEIWWAALPDPVGSGPGYRRPVLVIQANAFNESRIGTTVVAAVTSNLALASAPGNVRLRPRASGLARESVVNVSQILTVDKRLLTERVKKLDESLLADVDAGLRLSLAL
jgi:mRNA interferase MazF